MKSTYTHHSGLTFDHLPNWVIEDEGNILSVYDPDRGVGVLQFSIYEVADNDSIELKGELESFLADQHKNCKVQLLKAYAYCKVDDNEGSYWYNWLFKVDKLLVFGTYNCLKENDGLEDDSIRSIVNTAIA